MAKKEKFKVIDWINTGIFPATVMVAAGHTHHEICAYLKKVNAEVWLKGIAEDKTIFERGSWWALKREMLHPKHGTKTLYYILLKDCFGFKDDDFSKLAHECLHICQFFLPDVLDRNKELEAEAYLHTHLMDQCIKTFRGK